MYRGLERPGVTQLVPACVAYERGVSLCGMSKVYGMPGIRIGWLAFGGALSGADGDDSLQSRVGELKDYTTICSATTSEVLALIGLRNADLLSRRSQRFASEGHRLVSSFMAARPDHLIWPSVRAGSMAYPRLRDCASSEAYCERLLSH